MELRDYLIRPRSLHSDNINSKRIDYTKKKEDYKMLYLFIFSQYVQ